MTGDDVARIIICSLVAAWVFTAIECGSAYVGGYVSEWRKLRRERSEHAGR